MVKKKKQTKRERERGLKEKSERYERRPLKRGRARPEPEEEEESAPGYSALIEMADGSQWQVIGRTQEELARNAQDLIGRDLKGENYYVRSAERDGRFDHQEINELMRRVRG